MNHSILLILVIYLNKQTIRPLPISFLLIVKKFRWRENRILY